MRILVHDRSGHPFQVELSRSLATRGHEVLHSYGAFFQGPKGPLAPREDDPESFAIEAIELPGIFRKYSPRRLLQEYRFSKLLFRQIEAFEPEALLLGNLPPDALAQLFRRRHDGLGRWVVWVQDLYGVAIRRLLGRKWPLVGPAIGRFYTELEERALRKADELVLISEDFESEVLAAGVSREKISVIPNWAPLADLELREKDNSWSRERGLASPFVFLYSGTLGLKHDPEILLSLARHFDAQGSRAQVVVVSEGLGAERIRAAVEREGLANLRILPFQDYGDLPDVFASADVLVAILEDQAGVYSVPSKILSYLCAGRPLLLALPESNRASRMVRSAGAGEVVSADDPAAFLEAAERLFQEPERRARMAFAARALAEREFAIAPITDRFENLLRGS